MDLDEDEQKFPLVLAKNVKTFTVECWDTNSLDWVDTWEDTNAIPPMIRVGLVLGISAEVNKQNADFAVVRAFAVPSAMMPAAVQRGTAGGSPGGGGGLQIPTPRR
jgi:hypothetical protein